MWSRRSGPSPTSLPRRRHVIGNAFEDVEELTIAALATPALAGWQSGDRAQVDHPLHDLDGDRPGPSFPQPRSWPGPLSGQHSETPAAGAFSSCGLPP